MHKEPLISIIVPAYNTESMIEECIQSILCQIKNSHELIVIDDGSTDKTYSVLTDLKNKSNKSNFYLLQQTNQGQSTARNRAISLAKGDYILCIDSDDVLCKQALDLLENNIIKYQTDVFVFDFNLWFSNQNKKTLIQMGYLPRTVITDRDTIISVFFMDRKTSACFFVFKRDIYEKKNKPIFPVGCFYEDSTTVPQLLIDCRNLFYVPKPIIDYRQHSNSTSKTISTKHCLDLISCFLPVKEYFIEKKVSNTIKKHFDVAACHFYLETIKRSYQLPASTGKKIRIESKNILLKTLFHDINEILTIMEQNKIPSLDYDLDKTNAKKIKLSISGDLIFHIRRVVSAEIKKWRSKNK